MARGIFPHEISDPDFQWLIKNYCDSKGAVAVVDSGCLPLVIVLLEDEKAPLPIAEISSEALPGALAGSNDDATGIDDPKKG